MSMMVSQGAIIRAMNKSSAPRRLIYLNYGILRHEEYKGESQSHEHPEAIRNNYANRTSYIPNSISWMIKKVWSLAI
jgi:predicted transcriptional regulator with HTH domain